MDSVTFHIVKGAITLRNAAFAEDCCCLGRVTAYVVTEFLAISSILLALVEGIVRFVLTLFLLPFGMCCNMCGGTPCFLPGWCGRTFVIGPIRAILTTIAAMHVAIYNLNPFIKELNLATIHVNCFGGRTTIKI